MFLITSISMLRERTTGTLERLMTLPLSKLDVLAGYGLAFGLVAAVQASAATAYTVLVLGLDLQGSAAAVLAVAVGNALLARVADGRGGSWLALDVAVLAAATALALALGAATLRRRTS